MKLEKHWKMLWGRRLSLTNGVWKLKGGGKGASLEVLLPVVEDGQEEADGLGSLRVEPNKLFLQSLALSER
jgi:hypothetical protein